ncbi:type II secretion system protein N [Methylomagnum sp.]
MAKLSRDYLLPSILGCVAAALGLALAIEWAVLARHRSHDLAPSPAKAAVAPEAEATDAGKEFDLPEENEYEQMAERPLFMENRKPGVDAAAEPPPAVPVGPMTLKLMGIVWTPEGKLALVADAKGKYKRLKPQDSLDGWTLVELGTDKVTMLQGERREELTLLKKRPKAPTGGPPPVPGQPMAGQPQRPGPGQRPMPPVPMQPDAMMPDEENPDMPEDDMNGEITDEEAADEGQ